jgi:carbon storage regulator
MLVLSRKVGEAIVIDGGIRIRIASIQGKSVRVAIEAPRSTRVDRQEVYERLVRDGFHQPEAGPEPCLCLNHVGEGV